MQLRLEILTTLFKRYKIKQEKEKTIKSKETYLI